MEQLNLAIAQMRSDETPANNLQQILSLWASLGSKKKVNGLCLPENSLFNKVKTSSPGLSLNSPEIIELQRLARFENIFINLGALPFKGPEGVVNATLFIRSSGELNVVYKKIHLFDLNMGSVSIKESDSFIAGDKASTIMVNDWKMSFAICYDLRFTELFLQYAKQESELIFVPAAFTRLTGRAHWHVLLRARAIENQCYVVAPAQTGRVEVDGEVRASFGNSLVVDPWGKIILELTGDEPEIAVISMQKSKVQQTRLQMPIQSHRRL